MVVDSAITDTEERRRITTDLSSSMFVEAGAGTGKTSVLVDRVVALITRGEATIDQIVGITFTRSAASELRERVALRLEVESVNRNIDDVVSARIVQALEHIETAAFQTIDSFALKLLQDRPLEAGLPPVIETLDDVQAKIAFGERWDKWIDLKLDEDRFAERLARLDGLGLANPLNALSELAEGFHRNYEILKQVDINVPDNRVFDSPRMVAITASNLEKLKKHNQDSDDKLYKHIAFVSRVAAEIRSVGIDSDEAIEVLALSPKLRTSVGSQRNWAPTVDGVNACKFVKDELIKLQLSVDADLHSARYASLTPIIDEIAKFVLEYADERRSAGLAEFQDLLVWARDLLSSCPEVLRQFRQRFTRILIDEFQDTNPLQLEIISLLVAGLEGRKPVSGALFVVGDPKQSIYRFRQADIGSVARGLRLISDDPVRLAQNFRSHSRILQWINSVFSSWMVTTTRFTQASYVDLVTNVSSPEGNPAPGVHYFGTEFKQALGAVRALEANHIASIAASVGRGAWQVRDENSEAGMRISKWGDLCILLRQRSGLDLLEQTLQNAGIPYSLEGQSLIWSSQQVRELMTSLAAIDDPSDQVALVAALRSPAFGCRDLDLSNWISRGGVFDFSATNNLDGPVAEALETLAHFYDLKMWVSVPELIERFIRDRRLRELASISPARRSLLRLLQVVIEKARVLSVAGRPSLRQFVEWVAEQVTAGARAGDGGLDDNHSDAVRVMTVHSAKGLEFPIVLISGINSRINFRPPKVLIGSGEYNGQFAVRLGNKNHPFEWGDYSTLSAFEKRADDAENVRVIYVASTRAKDHLVVSMYRRSEKNGTCLAAKLATHTDKQTPWRELRVSRTNRVGTPLKISDRPSGPEQLNDFAECRRILVDAASKPLGISATALKEFDATLEFNESDHFDLGSQRNRKAATAMGRAVHSVLQNVNMETGDNLSDLATWHASHQDVPGSANEVLKLATATIEVPIVQHAIKLGCQREVYVAAVLKRGTVIEGFIDLMFEDESGGIVIVDYKTDYLGNHKTLLHAASPYITQMGAYVLATELTTGREVTEAWLVFSRGTPTGAVAYRLPSVKHASKAALKAIHEFSAG